jgi:enterochelin esterase-like enzyme
MNRGVSHNNFAMTTKNLVMRAIGAVMVGLAAAHAVAGGPLSGHIEQQSFVGPVTGQLVQFNIYLPAGYDAPGNTHQYPVVYHLHGLGGSQGGPQIQTVPASFEDARAKGIIGPVIIVFANGYVDSFWANAISGLKQAETDVIAQLIPHVDANYRTIAEPGARAIEGFSMGGFGATKCYAKYPELFAACIEYDGAMVTWPVMLQFHAQQAQEIFGNSEAYFNQYSPWHWTTQNAKTLQAKPPIRMVVGALVGGNQNFRNHLQSLNIPVEYVVTGCGHELPCLLDAQGLESAAFLNEHFELPIAQADLDADGDVDVDDLLAVINAWGPCGEGPAECAADINGSNAVDVDDLLMVLNAWG